jgi:hypothetical protein
MTSPAKPSKFITHLTSQLHAREAEGFLGLVAIPFAPAAAAA